MDKLKLRILSLTLAGISLFTLSSCSLKKDTPYNDTSILSNLDNRDFSNINDKFLRNTIEEFVTTVNESKIDINWDFDSFYDKIENCIFQKIEDEGFILGSYNRDTNIFTYQEKDKETINHELMHVLLPYFDNDCLNEGFDTLLLKEIFGYEINENVFDTAMCKILCRVLSTDELKDLLSGNYEVLPTKLSNIVPTYEDAKEFLYYLHESDNRYRKMCEYYYNDKLDEYKEDVRYNDLVSLRSCIKDRTKVYLKTFYSNDEYRTKSPEEEIIEMFEVLNIVDYELYDETLDNGVHDKDYFLEDIINSYCDENDINKERLVELDEVSRANNTSFAYLPTKGNSMKKSN